MPRLGETMDNTVDLKSAVEITCCVLKNSPKVRQHERQTSCPQANEEANCECVGA